MHLLKICKKEISNNIIFCMYLMFQSVVVMIAILFGISVFTTRYEKYGAIMSLIGDKGIIMDAENIAIAGDNPDNIICSEPYQVEELFDGAKAICTYNVWAEYSYNGKKLFYQPSTTAYDNEVAAAYEPELMAGQWLNDEALQTTDIVEAVITNNQYGIDVGDSLYIENSESTNKLEKPIEVKIIGVIADGEDFLSSRKSTDYYGDVRDFYEQYTAEYSAVPKLLILKEDFLNVENEVEGQPCIGVVVNGAQFLSYNKNITDEQLNNINECLKSTKCSLYYSIDSKTFEKNSKKYIWRQLDEVLPIFIGLIILVIMSAIYSSAIMTKSQIKNYALYYLLGLKWSDCMVIQVLEQLLIQGTAFIITMAGLYLTVRYKIFGDTLLELGVEQVAGCALYIVICILVSIIMPIKIISSSSPKEVLTNVD